ncbi:cysteine dioxygenase [Caulobacter segnis]|uniref:cysteine dioxygenase family protein n=1 Tax=Caulobacter segnis TaxID=88688 RepID=UPI001CBE5DE9|nr:cysteine dioxygenase [Caulobacter segnis]UAL12635.1 cysteine dioxygenase [Caulobacter segnis]
MSQHRPHRLSDFVADLSHLLDQTSDEAVILREGGVLLAELVTNDDWLPEAQSQPDPIRYQQYLLHRDPAGRFSVVSFVWGPGQSTPVHDHTVWGLVGVLRGAELSQAYERRGETLAAVGVAHRLEPGQIEAVSPTVGDIHRVTNAFDDRTSISIHVYGADIGTVKRSTYDAEGKAKTFISGYADVPPPLLFDRASALAYGAAE